MTRASLLGLLARPTALTSADVHALEELAEAFPYCQTAHLLLAKATHDQGSMLAGLRLRRAATYATDRALLRQLIEAAPPTPVPEPYVAAVPTAEAVASVSLVAASIPATVAVIADLETAPAPVVAPPQVLEDKPEQELGPASIAEIPAPEPDLPPQAPPIRPPAEAEVARYEFGLSDEEPAEIVAYQLAEPAKDAEVLSTPATPRLPPFGGVADVGYAPGEGSRLGFCLFPGASVEAAQGLIPTAILPPAGEFFVPDALVLAHLAVEAEPAAVPAATSLDLINSFLRRTPTAQRWRPALAASPDEQPDLSVRSTQAEPDLASESLAKILARQGKTERAIAIYERLIVKNPGKMAYFVAQIDQLRPSA